MLARPKSKLNAILTKSYTELQPVGQVLFLYLLVTEKDHAACDGYLLQEDRTIDDLMRIRDALNEFEIGDEFKNRLIDLRVAISAFIFSKAPEPMELMPPVSVPPLSAPPLSAPIPVPVARAPLFHSDPLFSFADADADFEEFKPQPVPAAVEHGNKSRGRRAPHKRPAAAPRENRSNHSDFLLHFQYSQLTPGKQRDFIDAVLNHVDPDRWETILQSQMAESVNNITGLLKDARRNHGAHLKFPQFFEAVGVCVAMYKSQHETVSNNSSNNSNSSAPPLRVPSPVRPSMFPPVPKQEPVDVKQLWIDKLNKYRLTIDVRIQGKPERAFMEISMVQLLIRVLQNAIEPESLTGHPNYREVFGGEQLRQIAGEALRYVESKVVERAASRFNPGK
jgi:hypothetical protein